MPNGIEDYYKFISEPWGKIFYETLFIQLNLSNEKPLKILDYGSGFGVTANYYANIHNVIAIEPNSMMSDKRFSDNEYTQITGGIEVLKNFSDNLFDVIFCHNVLEYNENKKEIFQSLLQVLKPNGLLSIVKHNEYGKVIHKSVFNASPCDALKLLENPRNDDSSTFGERYLYSNKDIENWCSESCAVVDKILGVRTFFSLIQDNSIKYNNEWYKNMLELELKVSSIDDFIKIAFFNHLIIKKG